MSSQKKSMNKMYIIVGAVVGIIVLVSILSVPAITSMSLDQILKDRDCTALEKWSEEHIYDENLSITNEQQSKIMSVGFECGMRSVNNILPGISGIITSQSEKDSSEIITQSEKARPVNSITTDKYTYQSGEIVNVEVNVNDPTIKDVSIILRSWNEYDERVQKENVSIDQFGNGYVDFVTPEIYTDDGVGTKFYLKMFVAGKSKAIASDLFYIFSKEMPNNIFSEIDSLHSELNDKVSQSAVSVTLVPWITDVTIDESAYRNNDTVKVAVWLSHQVSEDVVVNFMNSDKEIIQETLLTTKEFGVGSADFIMPEIELCDVGASKCLVYVQSYLKNYPEPMFTKSFKFMEEKWWMKSTDKSSEKVDTKTEYWWDNKPSEKVEEEEKGVP